MPIVSRSSLQSAAVLVRDETVIGANTATRVGGVLKDLADSVQLAADAIPLPRQLFVDPSIPADAAPVYKTIQAAINSIAQPQSAAAEIYLPPGQALTENLTFPGGCQISIVGGEFSAAITGSVVDTGGTAFTFIHFKGVILTGNISLTANQNFNQLWFDNTIYAGNVAANHYDVVAFSSFEFCSNHVTGDAFTRGSITGTIDCNNCALRAVTYSGASITAHGVSCLLSLEKVALGSAVSISVPFVDIINTTVHQSGPVTLSAGARADAYSMGQLLSRGVTCTTGTLALLGADVSLPSTAFAANVGATTIASSTPPAGLYRADVSMLKTVAGTSGVASFNISTTDSLGAFTSPVATLDVVTDTRKQGSLVFRSNGTAQITYSITGVTTAGSLAATHKLVLTKVD